MKYIFGSSSNKFKPPECLLKYLKKQTKQTEKGYKHYKYFPKTTSRIFSDIGNNVKITWSIKYKYQRKQKSPGVFTSKNYYWRKRNI